MFVLLKGMFLLKVKKKNTFKHVKRLTNLLSKMKPPQKSENR